MSPHTDPGALLKLADWLKHMHGLNQTIAHLPGAADHIEDLKKWEGWARQAASHGREGGEAVEDAHYLSAIRKRLEQLYDASADDPRLREQLSDEVDWVDTRLEQQNPRIKTITRIISNLEVVQSNDQSQWQDALDAWAKENLPVESAGCITSWSDRIAEFICAHVANTEALALPPPVKTGGEAETSNGGTTYSPIGRNADGIEVYKRDARPVDAGAAQAQTGCDKEATFGEDGYNPAYDDGITFAIVQLAELTGSKDWQMRDGSEDHDTDVRDTIMDVLKCAGLYDDETGKFAALAQAAAPPSLQDTLASCKGEHSKFEAWATAQKYDMSEHPIHYLFTDPKTYAARQGWKAALEYVASSLTSAQGNTPSDGAIYAAVSQRDATADELAELNEAMESARADPDEPANEYVKDDGQFGAGA